MGCIDFSSQIQVFQQVVVDEAFQFHFFMSIISNLGAAYAPGRQSNHLATPMLSVALIKKSGPEG